MKTWHVTHSSNGYELHVTEVPWWALAISHLADSGDAVCGHVFCGQGTPEVLWRIPVGRAVYSEVEGERWLENSVAGKLYSVFNGAVGFAWTHERLLHRLTISAEVAKALGADWDFDESETN